MVRVWVAGETVRSLVTYTWAISERVRYELLIYKTLYKFVC